MNLISTMLKMNKCLFPYISIIEKVVSSHFTMLIHEISFTHYSRYNTINYNVMTS